MPDTDSSSQVALSLRNTADSHLQEARQFAETVQTASSLFVREQAFNGLRFSAERCREAVLQIQSEFLDNEETLVEADQLQTYNLYNTFCIQTEAQLVALISQAAATTYLRRRRVAAISAIVVVCFVPICWLLVSNSDKVEPTTIEPKKELVGSKYFQARIGERLHALSGNSFDVYNGGLVTAESQSTGTVNDGGVAVVKDGALVTARSGATVYVYPGGTVVAEAGAEIIAAQGAIVQQKDAKAKVIYQQPAEWPNLVR